MTTYEKPTFTHQEVERFEKFIDTQIGKGKQQIGISTGFISDDTQRLQTYLAFYYPSGSFSPNFNCRNYRIAKNGIKYIKKENW